jgi:hypothetical protein
MTTRIETFDAEYSAELIEQAGHAFRDYLFRRYGPWLIAACVINAIALALCLWLGVEAGPLLWVIVFVVVIGPVWLAYEYFIEPHRYAAKLRRVLPSHGRVSVDAEAVLFVVNGKESKLPWSLVKVVVETQAFFLLVVSPFAFTFVPKSGLPGAAYDTLQAKSRAGAA